MHFNEAIDLNCHKHLSFSSWFTFNNVQTKLQKHVQQTLNLLLCYFGVGKILILKLFFNQDKKQKTVSWWLFSINMFSGYLLVFCCLYKFSYVFCYCFSTHTAPLNFNLNMATVGMLLIVLFLSGELFYVWSLSLLMFVTRNFYNKSKVLDGGG